MYQSVEVNLYCFEGINYTILFVWIQLDLYFYVSFCVNIVIESAAKAMGDESQHEAEVVLS